MISYPLHDATRAPWLRGLGRMWLALAASAAIGADAALPDSKPVSVRDLIMIAQQDNKDLQTVRYALDVARARLLQAGLRPNPRLDLSNRSDFAFQNDGSYARSATINQPFSIAGRIARQQDVARVDIALAEAEIALTQRRLAADVAERGYRLYMMDRQARARDALIGVQESLLKVARDRFKAAEVSELDVNTLQIDVQRLMQEQALLRTERRSLVASVNVLLGRAALEVLNFDEPLVINPSLPPLESLQKRALAERPEIRSAMLSGDRARAQRALSRSQQWEDWSVGLELSQDRLSISGVPPQRGDRAIGINLSIPLPLFNKSQGLIAEADAASRQADTRLEALRLSIASEVDVAFGELSQLQSSSKQMSEQQMPLAERNVRLALQGYQQGLVPLFEVVQIQRQQAELTASYLALLQQLLLARVRLHDAVGDYVPASGSNYEDY